MSASRIVVSGWYGAGNTGDEAILAGLIETLRGLGIPCEICALSYDPEDLVRRFGIDACPHLPSGFLRGIACAADGTLLRTLTAIRRADLFVLGGGGFLSDWQKEAPWLWLRQLMLARALGKPTLVLGVGAGPFRSQRGKFLTRKILNGFAAHITVRDERSRRWLLDIGVKRDVRTSGDPSLSLRPDEAGGAACIERLGLHGKRLVGMNAIPLFSGREWGQRTHRYGSLVRHLSDIATHISRDLGFHILGIPFMSMDRLLLGEVTSHLEEGCCTILDHRIPPGALLSVFGRLEAFIGMRYHSLLFSALAATPFYAIVYHHKGKELVSDLRMEPFSQELGDGSQAQDRDLDVSEIKTAFGRLLSRQGEIRERLGEGMALLKERERQNRDMLRHVLEESRRAG